MSLQRPTLLVLLPALLVGSLADRSILAQTQTEVSAALETEIPGVAAFTFMGDGEMDEPESMGAISLAGREKLDNLVFVINCNLQRLDGPVRGNGKIIQELETNFRAPAGT